MALTAGMVTALAAKEALIFHAVEIVLPTATIRLLDAQGSVTFSSKTFTGVDATYGALGGVESIREEIGLEAPRTRVVIMPKTVAALSTILLETNQEAPISIWLGCITRSTGAVVSSPELLFTGFYDTAKGVAGLNSLMAEIDVASDWERFFAGDEAAELNTAWHQSVWPGELGLDFALDSLADPYWGIKSPEETAQLSSQIGGGTGAISNALRNGLGI